MNGLLCNGGGSTILHQFPASVQTGEAQREKQIELVLMSTSSLYGDLQGIIGNTMPEIEAVCLLQLPKPLDDE